MNQEIFQKLILKKSLQIVENISDWGEAIRVIRVHFSMQMLDTQCWYEGFSINW